MVIETDPKCSSYLANSEHWRKHDLSLYIIKKNILI